MKKLMLILTIIPTLTFAWDGFDYNNAKFVDIEKGSVVREGNDIEIFDWGDGTYKDVEVQSVDSYGGTTEVEYIDPDSGETEPIDWE